MTEERTLASGNENRRVQTKHRTSVACRRCNSRKVKCTASSGTPCAGCLAANVDCVLIDSQRGRYVRNRNRFSNSAQKRSAQSQNHVSETIPRADGSRIDAGTSESVWVPGHREIGQTPSSADSPEMLYARIAEEIDRPQKRITNTSESVFLGEAFSLTYVVHNVLAPFLSSAPSYQPRLHFPLAAPSLNPFVVPSRRNIVNGQVEHLRRLGLFYRPPVAILQELLKAFFDCFHPAFPVIDQAKFLDSVASNEASLFVLNSILLIAVTVCEEELLGNLAAKDRYDARRIFYRQAKALYDSDCEPDKLDSIIGVFFISFWWGEPDEQKDSWHWLGIASSLAQSMGMHRSTSNSDVNASTARAWRRVWWSIRTRDALVSGSIGRPQHMTDADCDVEPLSVEDVQGVIVDATAEKLSYASQMAELTTIFSKIITSRYSSKSSIASSTNKLELETALAVFRQNMPLGIQYEGISPDGAGLWSAMLLMAFNYATILLCRPARSTSGQGESGNWGNTPKAFTAANEVTRVMEDILVASIGRQCQIHTIPALHNALAMHVFAICTSQTIGRELAENRARTCMLGLSMLQKSWPVGNWVYRFFVSIMERLQSKSQRDSAISTDKTAPTRPAREEGSIQSRQQASDHPFRPWEVQTPSRGAEYRDYAERQADRVRRDQPSVQGQNFDQYQIHDIGGRTYVPDIFTFGDATIDTIFDQGEFFDHLNLPTWTSFGY